MRSYRFNLLLALTTALALTGCGGRDTEVDSIPGPGARSSVHTPPPVELRHNQTEVPGVTAGVNSAGQPSSSAGGHTGPSTIGETKGHEPGGQAATPPAGAR